MFKKLFNLIFRRKKTVTVQNRVEVSSSFGNAQAMIDELNRQRRRKEQAFKGRVGHFKPDHPAGGPIDPLHPASPLSGLGQIETFNHPTLRGHAHEGHHSHSHSHGGSDSCSSSSGSSSSGSSSCD